MKFTTKKKLSDETKESIIFCSTIAVLGTCLIASGYLCGYKIGYKAGCKSGRNHTLDDIVDKSCYNGLKMVNSLNEHYVFTAKKLTD